jgi:hypothetical protein
LRSHPLHVKQVPQRCYQHYCCRRWKRKSSSSSYSVGHVTARLPLADTSKLHPHGVASVNWCALTLLVNVGINSKTKRAVRSTVRCWWDLHLRSCIISFLSFGIAFVLYLAQAFDERNHVLAVIPFGATLEGGFGLRDVQQPERWRHS